MEGTIKIVHFRTRHTYGTKQVEQKTKCRNQKDAKNICAKPNPKIKISYTIVFFLFCFWQLLYTTYKSNNKLNTFTVFL